MIRDLNTFRGLGNDPYENLAVEELLLRRAGEGRCILYLWQNAHTVVIGRNQNPWKECRTTLLRQEGGRLARRLSGGGAVYHDLGNLNFTFLMPEADYDLSRQLSVILKACEALSIPAEASGRNDLLLCGKKFSGSAFYKSGGAAYHHGTLMLDVDMERVNRYLQPSQAKLAAKGVDSVRSRVINLRSYLPGLTVDALCSALTDAFSKVYGGEPEPLQLSGEELARLSALRGRYSSEEWLFGRSLPTTLCCEHRFAWGEVELRLLANRGVVEQTQCYSDAMDWRISGQVEQALTGCRFSVPDLTSALWNTDLPETVRSDLINLLEQQEI